MPETIAPRVQKRAGNMLEVTRGPGKALSMGQPCSPKARRAERHKSKEKLPGSFYEVIITLTTKPVKNSINTKETTDSLTFEYGQKIFEKNFNELDQSTLKQRSVILKQGLF